MVKELVKVEDMDSFEGMCFGLFWFDGKYTEITRVEEIYGLERFRDVENVMFIPVVNHSFYDEKHAWSKRGMVVVLDGRVIVCVGLECPESGIKLVVNKFKLGVVGYEIRRNPQWNGNGGL